MCYHLSIGVGITEIEQRPDARFPDPAMLQTAYQVSALSGPHLPVIANDDTLLVRPFEWGLIPFWVKEEDAADRARRRTLNARAETILEKPSVRRAVRQNGASSSPTASTSGGNSRAGTTRTTSS